MSDPTPPAAANRRVPPPCWTDDEAQALISFFKEKWTSLGRTNLKSNDWDDVASAVASRFPLISPSKTAVQCRHKMEKLRKRYRSERQRAETRPGRFSPWALYQFLDDLEGNPSITATPGLGSDPAHRTRKQPGSGSRFLSPLDEFVSRGSGGVGDSAFPVKSLGHRNVVPLIPKMKMKRDNMCRKFGGDWEANGVVGGGGSSSLLRSVKEVDQFGDVVSSIELLGEKYVKSEKRKMEMARDIAMMQMDMEMKQTRFILESQHQMVEACVSALLESKKTKKKKIKVVSADL